MIHDERRHGADYALLHPALPPVYVGPLAGRSEDFWAYYWRGLSTIDNSDTTDELLKTDKRPDIEVSS